MERESCLVIVIILAGGAAVLACGLWPVGVVRESGGRRLERIAWRRLWIPLMPAVWPSLVLGIIFGEPVIRTLFWFAG
jgi:hypothetical protein